MKPKKLFFASVLALALPLGVISLAAAASFNRNTQKVRAVDVPSASNVFIEDVSFNSNRYFKNGDTDTFTGDEDHYNAFYDETEGILHLVDYDGGKIRCTSSQKLVIQNSGTSLIYGAEEGDYNLAVVESSGDLEVNGDGILNLVGVKESTRGFSRGFYVHGELDLHGSLAVAIDLSGAQASSAAIETAKLFFVTDDVELDINVSSHPTDLNYTYGIYAAEGSITLDTTGEININVEANNTSGYNFAIYNQALNVDAPNNGDIDIGGTGKITLRKLGDGYANGIVSNYDAEENTDGVFGFSGCDIEIYDFAYAVWNKCAQMDSDAYDIYLTGGAKVKIESEYPDFAYGLVSQKNGIDVSDSDFYYEGTGYPIHLAGSPGFYNYSKYGFDVYGNSHIDIKTNKYITTNSDATCFFNLDYDGYFDYRNLEDKFPSLQGSFFIKLGSGTRLVDAVHFVLDGSYGTTTEGGIKLGHYSGNDNDHIRFEAFENPDAEQISVNEVPFTSTKLYYVNDAAEPTSNPEGYNAKYDPAKGYLYLKNYVGKDISFTSNTGGLLTIVIEEDSTITAPTGIDVRGNGRVEITTATLNSRSLTINSTSNNGNANGISITGGDLTIGGYADITINAEVTSEETGLARGIYVGYVNTANVRVKDHARLDITVKSAHESDLGQNNAICVAQGKLTFDVVNNQYFSSKAVAGDSYTIWTSSGVKINKCNQIKCWWSGDGTHSGAVYPKTSLTTLDNCAVNTHETERWASIDYGAPCHIEVKNGYCDNNHPSGNYVINSSGTISANYISSEVPFSHWEQTGSSNIYYPENSSTGLQVKGNETFTAVYDFVNKQPVFDTRGNDEYGYIQYSFKGTKTKVFIVTEDGDETDVVYSSNVSSSTMLGSSELPNGTYKLCASYTSTNGKTNYLFSDKFVVNHKAPALDWKVTYHSNTENEVTKELVLHGTYYLLEDLPEEFTAPEGKRLYKWALDRPSGSQYNKGGYYNVVRDVDFYAIYENIPTHSLNFIHNGNATGSMNASQLYEGTYFELPTPTFVPNAWYEFKGWQVTYDGQDPVMKQPGEEILIPAYNMTITAIYEEIATHTLTFHHGEGTGSMDSVVLHEGQHYTIPASTFTAPENFEFHYWEIRGVQREAGYDFVMMDEDVLCIAHYKRIECLVSYDAGLGSGSMEAEYRGKGLTMTLPTESTFVAPAHQQLSGWEINGVEYELGAEYTVTDDVTIKALYSDITWTITFNNGGGSGSLDPVNKVDGQEYTLPECTLTAPEGQEFDCWLVNGEEYAEGAEITVTSNVTVTAKWKDIVTLDHISLSGTFRTSFTKGEEFTSEGLVVNAHYSNGTSHEVEGYTVSTPDMDQLGEQTITVTYTEDGVTRSAKYQITISKAPAPKPAKSGLSGGAIAGIVIPSVLLLAVGGFALVWFVILKKTWAQFLAIFKKK